MPTPPEYRIIYNWDGAPHGSTAILSRRSL